MWRAAGAAELYVSHNKSLGIIRVELIFYRHISLIVLYRTTPLTKTLVSQRLERSHTVIHSMALPQIVVHLGSSLDSGTQSRNVYD